MKYDYNYFHDSLMLRKNENFSLYKDEKEFDLLIEQLNHEIIYDYTEVDWTLFSSDFFSYKWEYDRNSNEEYVVLAKDQKIESVANMIIPREVRVKLLRYIQKHYNTFFCVESINQAFIENECARLISANISESVRDKFAGEFASMPRPDYRAMLQDESLFKKKTCSGEFIEARFEEHAKRNKEREELLKNVNTYEQYLKETLAEFADKTADSSNYCPSLRVVDEALAIFENFQKSGDNNTDAWQRIDKVYDKLNAEVDNRYWRKTPGYQVLAAVYILLSGKKIMDVRDKSFASSIASVVFNRPNWGVSKEEADEVVAKLVRKQKELFEPETLEPQPDLQQEEIDRLTSELKANQGLLDAVLKSRNMILEELKESKNKIAELEEKLAEAKPTFSEEDLAPVDAPTAIRFRLALNLMEKAGITTGNHPNSDIAKLASFLLNGSAQRLANMMSQSFVISEKHEDLVNKINEQLEKMKFPIEKIEC